MTNESFSEEIYVLGVDKLKKWKECDQSESLTQSII